MTHHPPHTIRRWLPYVLSFLGLLAMAAIGIQVERDPVLRDMQLRPKPQSLQQQLQIGLINGTDLPFGAQRIRHGDIRIGGGVGWYSIWSPSFFTRSGTTMNQELLAFTDRSVAAEVYDKEVADAIPVKYAHKWTHPEELNFSAHADRLTIACLPSKIAWNGDVTVIVSPEDQIAGEIFRSCVVIGLYDNMVVFLSGSVFEKQRLTMAQFRRLLERLDFRMERARLP